MWMLLLWMVLMVVMIIIIGYSGDDGCYADDGDDDVGDDDGNDGDDNYEYDECVNDDCNACGVGCEYTNVFGGYGATDGE